MTDLFPCLVWDSETTGIPRWDLPADHPSQPRVCQIAAALIDADETKPLEIGQAIIKPDGWSVPDEAARIHGLTTERCEAEGVPIQEALAAFMALFERAAIVASYGIQFDTKLLRGELRRLSLPDRFGEKPEFCVMRAVTPLCKLPPTEKMMAAARYTNKTPKLAEAAKILLDHEHTSAHTADGDVAVTVRLYRYLVNKGLVTPKVRPSNPQIVQGRPAAQPPKQPPAPDALDSLL